MPQTSIFRLYRTHKNIVSLSIVVYTYVLVYAQCLRPILFNAIEKSTSTTTSEGATEKTNNNNISVEERIHWIETRCIYKRYRDTGKIERKNEKMLKIMCIELDEEIESINNTKAKRCVQTNVDLVSELFALAMWSRRLKLRCAHLRFTKCRICRQWSAHNNAQHRPENEMEWFEFHVNTFYVWDGPNRDRRTIGKCRMRKENSEWDTARKMFPAKINEKKLCTVRSMHKHTKCKHRVSQNDKEKRTTVDHLMIRWSRR